MRTMRKVLQTELTGILYLLTGDLCATKKQVWVPRMMLQTSQLSTLWGHSQNSHSMLVVPCLGCLRPSSQRKVRCRSLLKIRELQTMCRVD